MKAKKKMTIRTYKGGEKSEGLKPGGKYFCMEHKHKDFLYVMDYYKNWTVCFKSNFEEEVTK